MVYHVHYDGPAQNFFELSSVLPPKWIGLVLIGLSFFFLLYYTKAKSTRDDRYLNKISLCIASFIYMAMYIGTFSYLDEVSVNLEHSYNLFNHGLFSFSPKRMVDGTVEFLYYTILSPFAWNVTSLLYANIIFGLFIGWLHLYILWKLLSDVDINLKLFLSGIFAAYVPLITIFSNGFGNSLVSLGFFLSIYFHLRGNSTRALIIAALLPIIRADAILYSLAVTFVVFLRERKIRLLFIALMLFSFFAYFGFVKMLYGHWIPTPMKFKSFTPAMISLLNVADVKSMIRYFVRDYHMAFLFIFFASFFLKDKSLSLLRYYGFPLLGIFVFYSMTKLGGTYSQDDRYIVGFECWQILFTVLFFKHVFENFSYNGKVLTSICFSGREIVLVVPVLVFFGAALYVIKQDASRMSLYGYHLTNFNGINEYGVGGQIVDRLIPDTWTLSATELNTMGLTNDREVIDLWGYTNPAIANSSTINAARKRNNPDYFLTIRPDVYWFYTHTTNKPGYLGLNIDNLETLVGHPGSSWGKQYNQLGDMIKVFQLYDGYVIYDDNWTTVMLVKRDSRESFHKILAGKNYKFSKQQEFDLKKLEEYNKSVSFE